MDPFQSAQLQYGELLGQLQAGTITREAFDEMAAQLRVQDARGTWWSISPTTGNWSWWDGASWTEAPQPEAQVAPATGPAFTQPPCGPDAFDQTADQYRALLARRKRGELDSAAFDRAVDALRVTDGGGAVWQIASQTGIWVRWDGQQWVEAEPPLQTPDGRPATELSIYAEFDRHYSQALGVFQQGGMSEQQFQVKVERLRVKDEKGVWWQILPATGQWARWDGTQWAPADPPRELVGAVGPVRKFAGTVVDSTKAQFTQTVRSIPRMVMGWLISRGIMMTVSYFGALYLHAYLAGYKNNGIRDDGGTWAPWLYLTGSKQGALSAPVIWGVAGMILTTLVLTTLRRGPIGAIKSFVRMPFSFVLMLKSGGRAGAGAIAMGAGAAILMKHYAGMNSQASFSLSLGMFFLGMGTAGRLISGFFLGIVRRIIAPQRQRLTQSVQRRLPLNLRTVQLVLVGVSPGFLLAARLGTGSHLLAAGVLLVLGFLLLFNIRKPGPSAGAAATLLFYGFFGSIIFLFLDLLTSRTAFADDKGRDEFGGKPEDYWPTEGEGLLNHSQPAAESSAAGAALGGDPGDEGEEPLEYSYFLTIDEAHMNLDRSLSEDVFARVEVTGPDPAECTAQSEKLTAAIQFAMSGNCTDWFTWGQDESAGSMRGYFTLQIPDDAGSIPGPHLVAFTASVATPNGILSRACKIAVSVAEGFELRMSNSMTAEANGPSTSFYCGIACTDDTIPDAQQIIDAAVPKLEFKLDGAQAHWVRGAGGEPGTLLPEIVPDGKEAVFSVEIPYEDLSVAPPYSASITAAVEIQEIGSLSQICTLEITSPEWFIEAKIIKNDLVLDNKDSAEICARLIPMDESKLALYGSAESNPLNNLLKVAGTGSNGQYAVFTEKEGEPGFRTWSVTFSQNLPANMGEIDPTMDVEISADITGQNLTQSITINLSGKPSLEVTEKSVAIRAGGESVPVHAKIKDGGELNWSLRIEIHNLDEVEPEGPPELDEANSFILKLRADELDPGDLRIRKGTLELTAHAPDPKTGEEIETDPVEVTLKLGQTGLSISPSPVRLPLDPETSQPVQFKVSVLKYNEETHVFDSAPELMSTIELRDWEDGEMPGGANTFNGAGVELAFLHMEGAEGVWSAKAKIQVPASQTIDAIREFTVPGDWGDQQELYTARHTFMVPVDPAALQGEKIRIEQENCRKTLKYVPEGPAKVKFAETIEKDARTLGAEGLYHLRHEIWEVARQALMDEAESYLQCARVLDTTVQVLDWTNYLCGLIVQGMSSVLVPFPGDLAVGMLYQAIPDCVNQVAAGKTASQWAKDWVGSLISGAPDMALDMGLGQVAGLEDLFLKGLAQYKDYRKAAGLACIVYWQVRFVRYQVTTKPDGEPYSLKESVLNGLRDLAEEIVTSGIGKATKFGKDGVPLTGLTDPYNGYDPKDGRVYNPSDDPPDMRGMPEANVKAAREIAQKHEVEIYIRPTNPASKKLLEAGAHPKPEKIKMKTINELDTKLGCKPGDVGKVGYFDPGDAPPPRGDMSKGDYDQLVDRFKQRKSEFDNYGRDINKLKKKGYKIDENGVILHPDGKPFTGDHDVYDIRGPGGKPVSKQKYDAVMKDMKKPPFSAQHNGHRQWDYSHLDKTKPPPTPGKNPGDPPQQGKSEWEKSHTVDSTIQDSHSSVTSKGRKGEALIKVDSNGRTSSANSNNANTYTSGQKAAQDAMKTKRRDGEEER
ncbi:hypothetical protein CVU37_07240 [candidate division BRC1 bacterium HGW-BRC1-1]|nr:MAG: hypothetical protein CVU37_07240 [candidate division BRC1 bacterium HGW-BRC1-1]